MMVRLPTHICVTRPQWIKGPLHLECHFYVYCMNCISAIYFACLCGSRYLLFERVKTKSGWDSARKMHWYYVFLVLTQWSIIVCGTTMYFAQLKGIWQVKISIYIIIIIGDKKTTTDNVKFNPRIMDKIPTLLYFVITCRQPILLMYLAHWGQHKMDAILQTAFWWVKIHELWLKFCWSLFLTTQLTIFQHLFGLWLGTDPATSHYLSQMVSLLMHICITLPQWVKDCFTGTGTLPARRCHGMEIQYIPRNMHTALLCFALLWLCNRS